MTTKTNPELNTRILIIDDEESVRDSFVQALSPRRPGDDKLSASAAALFGEPAREVPMSEIGIEFTVDIVENGRKGRALVEAALAEEWPYAVIFTDMRMPGWDGLQTAEHIRQIDPRCEIIFVTAYSDHSVETLSARVGANVGYFLKPFAVGEVKQMATKGVIDWNKAREMERFLETVTNLDGQTADIEELLRYFLGQLCLWMSTDSGALVELESSGSLRLRLGRGRLGDQATLDRVVSSMPALPDGEPSVGDGVIVFPIKEFGYAVAMTERRLVTPDRLYLLRAFLEHASLAIRNSETRAELARSRRLAAMGEALGRAVHDIRGPLGNAMLLLEFLRTDDIEPYTPEKLFELLEKSLQDTKAVINDTLEYIRGQAKLEKRRVELASALGRSIEMLGLELQSESIPLRASIPDELSASVDASVLGRALRNLVTNAGAALQGTPDPWIEIGAEPDGDGVCLWVSDNGPGIPEKIRDRVFEPFVTASKPGGTGLGLAIVKQVIEAHDGAITVRSSSEGTRFEIRLPG